MRYCGIYTFFVRFCGFRTPLTPPPAGINASIYSIDTTFYVLFPYVIDYVFRNSDAIIAKKQQKLMNQKKEHMRPGPGLRFVSVYMRTVRTQTGVLADLDPPVQIC